jgi:hypothetical protein
MQSVVKRKNLTDIDLRPIFRIVQMSAIYPASVESTMLVRRDHRKPAPPHTSVDREGPREMSPLEPIVPEAAFERVLHEAIVRPAGRKFRGEPTRQVAILRLLRERVKPVAFDDIFDHLRREGALRTTRDDAPSRRKTVHQALRAINDKLGQFFFAQRDIRMLSEMFRIALVGEETERPAATLQDFFGLRKTSGVRFFATSDEPAGGLTRELYELITELRPRRLDVFAASFSSFLGNPEFRQLLADAANRDDGKLRFLLLDPKSTDLPSLEKAVKSDAPLRGSMATRIETSLAHLAEITRDLPPKARARLEVRVAANAPLWRFRMIFLPETLHLRLIVPGSPAETLIKLDAASSLYRGLRDVFERAWETANPVRPSQ